MGVVLTTGAILLVCLAGVKASPGCNTMELGIAIPTPSNDADWTYVKQFVTSIISQLYIGRQDYLTQVGVVTYRGSSEAQFNLSRYQTKDELISAINALPMISTPGSDISGAMRTLRTEVLPFGYRRYHNYIPKVALTFTDQRAQNSQDLTTAYQEFNDNRVTSLAVGLTRDSLESDLIEMTDSSNDYLRLSGSFSDLSSRVSSVVQLLCAVRPNVCDQQADIGIIVDHSTSIVAEYNGGYDNWDVSLKDFLIQLIDSFPIGPTLTRMGMVGFSNNAWLYFGFDTHNNPRTLRQAVIDWEITGGETNIAQGFHVTRTELFSHARPNVTKIVILITDGRANRNRSDTIPEADATKAQGVEIFAVGITHDVDENQLRDIASPNTNQSRQHYFYVDNFEDLHSITEVLVNSSCTHARHYFITTTTGTTSRHVDI